MRSVIQSHNQKLLSKNTKPSDKKTCNCRKKELCPLQGNCLNSIVYRATLKCDGKEMKYIGCSANFKKRYTAHKSSFRNSNNQNATTLSTFIWENNLNPNPEVKWETLCTAPVYKPGGQTCELCLAEKMHICNNIHDTNCLNKRSEIAQRCRHRARHRLSAV